MFVEVEQVTPSLKMTICVHNHSCLWHYGFIWGPSGPRTHQDLVVLLYTDNKASSSLNVVVFWVNLWQQATISPFWFHDIWKQFSFFFFDNSICIKCSVKYKNIKKEFTFNQVTSYKTWKSWRKRGAILKRCLLQQVDRRSVSEILTRYTSNIWSFNEKAQEMSYSCLHLVKLCRAC